MEVLYHAQALVAEGPFYEQESDSLLWVDIFKNTINIFDLKTNQNRYLTKLTSQPYPSDAISFRHLFSCFVFSRALQVSQWVSAVIPVAGSRNQLLALLERKICLVDRDTGKSIIVHCPTLFVC